MIIKTDRNTKKYIITLTLFITFICAVTFFIFQQKQSTQINNPNNTTTGSNPSTGDQINPGEQNKTKPSNSDTPPEPTEVVGSDKKSVKMSITAINQTDQYLQIRSLINAVDDTGVCTLTISSASTDLIKETAETQQQAKISTCKGFDIPLSKLSKGSLSVSIEYASNQFISSVKKNFIVE